MTSNSPLALTAGTSAAPPPRALYAPKEVEAILGISHATLYRLIAAGRIEARKLDSKTVIPDESIRRFIDSLPAAKIGEAP